MEKDAMMEKNKFFEIIEKVSTSEGLNENNLLERIESELGKVDTKVYNTHSSLKIGRTFSVQSQGKVAHYTLLHLAVECKNAAVVKYLLKNKVKVDEPTYEIDGVKQKLTALHIAALHGEQGIIQLLLDAGANPCLQNGIGKNPREVVENSNISNKSAIIEMLKEREQCYVVGQSQARKQANERSALSQSSNDKTLEGLVVNRSDVTTALENGIDPYLGQCDATHSGEQASLSLITDKDGSNNSGIHIVLEDVDEGKVEFLAERDEDGRTYLHYAVEKNDEELAKFLIECGVKVDIQDKDGNTALHYAVVRNNKELVRSLIEHKAEIIDIRNEDDRTPLYFAAKYKFIQITKCLVNSGANVDAMDKDGYSPLYFFERKVHEYTQLVEFLKSKRFEIVPSTSFCSKANNLSDVMEAKEKARKLNNKVSKLRAQLGDKKDRIRLVDKEKEELHEKMEQAKKRLKETQDEYKTKLKVLSEENQSLKQKVQDLENKNTTLNSELGKTKTKINEMLLEKAGKRRSLKVACTSLVAILAVGTALSIVSGFSILLTIAISAVSALIAGIITYAISKPTTELQEVTIQDSTPTQCL